MSKPGWLVLGGYVCLVVLNAPAQTVTAVPARDAVPPARGTVHEEIAPPLPPPENIRPTPFPGPPKRQHPPEDNRPITRHRDGTITVGAPVPPNLMLPPSASEPARPGVNFSEASQDAAIRPLNFGGLSLVGSPQSWPHSAAVKIVYHFPTRGWFVCSGGMIDPAHVLTAGHCVYDTIYDEWADDFRVFPAGTDLTNAWTTPTAPFGSARGTQAHSFTGWTNSADWDYDIGVIDLDRTVGALSGWYGYGYHDSCSFYQINTFRTNGYPAESPYTGTSMYTRSGTFDSCDTVLGSWYGNEISFNARSYKGQSGSNQVASSNNVAYAVLSNGNTSVTNSPRIISSEYTSIQGFISADVPASVDVMPLWVRGSTSATAGTQLGSMTYYIHNYSSASVSQTYTVNLYLSTNDTISTSDRFLGSHTVSVNLASKGTVGVNVASPPTIPSDVAAGSYWLGVIISTSDANTANNDSSGQDALSLAISAAKPLVTVTASDSSAGEPSNSGEFTITRSGASVSASLSVSFTLSGSASNGSDYTSISSPVTIAAGSASRTIAVSPIDDALVEGSETVVLSLSSSSAYTIGSPNGATVTISDNDATPCFVLTAFGNPSNAGYAAVNTLPNCNSSTGYTTGTAISITGAPFNSSYQFSSWSSSNCALANANAETTTCTVTGAGNPSVSANFIPAACTSYSLAPVSATAGTASGSQLVTVTGSPAGCQGNWSATGNGSWITVFPTSGNGSGSVTVSWGQNPGSARSGTASIAARTFLVDQIGTSGVSFYAVPPCRLIDTRNPAGAYGGPALAAGLTRTITASGRCGIPAGVAALTVNLTAVNAPSDGFFTLFPGPAGSLAPAVSTLNYRGGKNRANNATVRVATDGTINIVNNGVDPVHFLIDVSGYFQ